MRFLIIIITMLLVCSLYGQHTQYTQEYSDFGIISYPSIVGFEERPKISHLYRTQWNGITGGPESLLIDYHVPDINKFSFDFHLRRDSYAFFNHSRIGLSMSRILRTKEHFFAIGLQFGFSHYGTDESKINVIHQDDEFIRLLLESSLTEIHLLTSFSYRYRDLNLDISLPQLFQKNLYSSQFPNLIHSNKMSFQGRIGYNFELENARQISLHPTFGYQHHREFGGFIDLVLNAQMKEVGDFTLGYRESFGWLSGFGVNIKTNLKFRYSYEFGAPNVPYIMRGYNEIGLIYIIKDRDN